MNKKWNRINSIELKIIPTDRSVSFLFNCLWHNALILLHRSMNDIDDIVITLHIQNEVINTPIFGANLKENKNCPNSVATAPAMRNSLLHIHQSGTIHIMQKRTYIYIWWMCNSAFIYLLLVAFFFSVLFFWILFFA